MNEIYWKKPVVAVRFVLMGTIIFGIIDETGLLTAFSILVIFSWMESSAYLRYIQKKRKELEIKNNELLAEIKKRIMEK